MRQVMPASFLFTAYLVPADTDIDDAVVAMDRELGSGAYS
jgi:hypothetical protein